MSSSLSSADFALSLLKTGSKHDENFVLSPFSLGAALALVHDGARGETQQQLTNLLLKDSSASAVTDHYSALTSDLKAASGDVTTNVANRLFLDDEFDPKPAYLKHVEEKYAAGVEKLALKKESDKSAQTINKFVSDKTEGMIKQIVKADALSEAVAVIINAIYFKGKWKQEFSKDRTSDDTFHGVKGDRQVPFMRNKVDGQYGETDDVQCVAIPYKDTSYSLVVMMPKGDFATWRASLNGAKFQEALGNMSKCKINLELPKFKIESTLPAKETLVKLGVNHIFCSPDLGEITDDPRVCVSDVIHKAVIDVSESGTTAAASTAVKMKTKCLRKSIEPKDFRVNRPFLYSVSARGRILFNGQMV